MLYFRFNIDFKNSDKQTIVIPMKASNNIGGKGQLENDFEMYKVKNCLLYIVYSRLKKAGITAPQDLNKLLKEFDNYLLYLVKVTPYKVLEPDKYDYVFSFEQVKEYNKRIKNITARYYVNLRISYSVPFTKFDSHVYAI